MVVNRRHFLTGSVGAAAMAGLTACSSVHSNSADTSSSSAPATSSGASSGGGAVAPVSGASSSPISSAAPSSRAPVKGDLTFSFWGGSTGETKGFTYVKDQFEKANPGTTINLKVVPYDGFFSGIDRGIQAGNAPDVFRVDYTTIGKYSGKDVLLDLTPYFDQSEIDAFLPALWEGIKFGGKPYGVPHQTDTTCVVYSKSAFTTAGITSVPTTLADAWTWDEFSGVATKLRASLPDKKFPFAYDWTQAGAFRWLSWLYQAGGTLLTPDLKKVALPSDAATAAMDYTKSFFTKKWTPDSNTIKTSQYSDNFFLSQVVPMSFVGDFLVPELADPKAGYKGDWGATFMPQNKAAASDLGGNAIVARKDTKNPDLAAAFLKFLVSEDMMKYFCEQAIELPTLKTLASADLKYVFRPDVVKICAEQASTISDTIVKESTVPSFATINTVLQDQLELAFHGKSTGDALSGIASGVSKALGS
jgi:multiple sugar transport system substrate-binding protein